MYIYIIYDHVWSLSNLPDFKVKAIWNPRKLRRLDEVAHALPSRETSASKDSRRKNGKTWNHMQPFFKNDGKLIWYNISYHIIMLLLIDLYRNLLCWYVMKWTTNKHVLVPEKMLKSWKPGKTCCWKQKIKLTSEKMDAAMEMNFFSEKKKLKWTELMSWVACYVLLMLWKAPGEICQSEFGRVRNYPVFKHIQISLGDMGIPPKSCEKKLEHDDTPWFGVVLCSNTPLPSGYFT